MATKPFKCPVCQQAPIVMEHETMRLGVLEKFRVCCPMLVCLRVEGPVATSADKAIKAWNTCVRRAKKLWDKEERDVES